MSGKFEGLETRYSIYHKERGHLGYAGRKDEAFRLAKKVYLRRKGMEYVIVEDRMGQMGRVSIWKIHRDGKKIEKMATREGMRV